MKKNGNCFPAAWETLNGIAPAMLKAMGEVKPQIAHGLVLHPDLNKYHAHAWVEVGALVFDQSNGNDVVLPAAWYYEAGQINPEKVARYTREEARANMLKHEHYGPWEQHLYDESELN